MVDWWYVGNEAAGSLTLFFKLRVVGLAIITSGYIEKL